MRASEKNCCGRKSSVQDGQDQLETGVQDLRWSASPEWRVLGGPEVGRQQGNVCEAYSAMQEADPGGEMTAVLGTKSDAMNVAQQEQEVLKHVAEIFVGSEAADDGE